MFFSLSSLAVAVLVTAVVGGVTAAGVVQKPGSLLGVRFQSGVVKLRDAPVPFGSHRPPTD